MQLGEVPIVVADAEHHAVIVAHVWPPALETGGSGGRFERPSTSYWAQLGFQKSAYSDRSDVRFTVNLSAKTPSVDGDPVLGVDACKAGWVGLACGRRAGARLCRGHDRGVGRLGAGRRSAGRGGPAPHSMLPITDHSTASARNRQLAGEGASIQAFGLRPKLHQVDRWVRQTPCDAVEVHPEVSFARLAGTPLTADKAGAHLRQRLLTLRRNLTG